MHPRSDVLNASQDRPFVMTEAASVEWIAQQVERGGESESAPQKAAPPLN
jgi:hypothetical protein